MTGWQGLPRIPWQTQIAGVALPQGGAGVNQPSGGAHSAVKDC
jgi:hypothetical protein